jgi:hypothetical protein
MSISINGDSNMGPLDGIKVLIEAFRPRVSNQRGDTQRGWILHDLRASLKRLVHYVDSGNAEC